MSLNTYFCLGSLFGKLTGFIAPEMVPWLSNKSEDQSGGPRTNLDVFGDEVSFQYFPKHENRLPPCHVRPNPATVRRNRFVWSMPCPRTPPDLPNPTFHVFCVCVGFLGFYRICRIPPRSITVSALTKDETLTCFVSEPDFRFSKLFFAKYFWEIWW